MAPPLSAERATAVPQPCWTRRRQPLRTVALRSPPVDGGGGTQLLLALSHLTMTTHPFRDGPLLLLLIEATSNIWALSTFFPCITQKNFLQRSSLAVCDHHLSPKRAIVFSLLFNAPNISMSHPFIFLISSFNAPRSTLYSSQSPTRRALLSSGLPEGQPCATSSSPARQLVFVFFLAGPGTLHESAV